MGPSHTPINTDSNTADSNTADSGTADAGPPDSAGPVDSATLDSVAGATTLDAVFMQQALQQAELACQRGDVPVGAVLVAGGVVIARGCNQTHTHFDPAGHAEIIALRRAAIVQQSPRLTDATLYVTLEPCAMCVGAMIHARINRLVFAAREPKTGAVSSAFELLDSPKHNHSIAVCEGVLADASVRLLQEFFAARRKPR